MCSLVFTSDYPTLDYIWIICDLSAIYLTNSYEVIDNGSPPKKDAYFEGGDIVIM